MKKLLCSCCLCKNTLTTNQLPIHYNSKQCKTGYLWSQKPKKTNLVCEFCGEHKKTAQSISQHQLYCKQNPHAQKKVPSYGMRGKKGANQYTYGAIMTDSTKHKIRNSTRQANIKRWSIPENKLKHALAMQKAARENPESYTNPIHRGRVKCFEYDGVRFQGSWELIFYKWAKSKGLDPVRVKQGFPYVWNGQRTYYPDFYLESLSLYVEVKGYKTDRDDAKWQQFPNKLLVVDKKAIDRIKQDSYTIES